MAGFKIVTDLDVEDAFKIARRVAKGLGFVVERTDDLAFSARKGNLALSIFLGALIAYCDFQVYLEDHNGKTEVVIERNKPWWTGWIGLNRVKNAAKELATAVADDLEHQGGRILKEKEI